MPNLTASDIGDLLRSTLKEYGKMKFTEIATDIQKHIALNELLKTNKETLNAGTSITWRLMVDQNNSARSVGLGSTDIVDVPDLMQEAEVPWRFMTGNWAIEHHVVDMNRDPAMLVSIVKEQRFGCLISMAEYFEDKVWRAPATTNLLDPYGIPYYVVKSNTAATQANNDGFNGLTPQDWTTVAGINPTTNPRWRNYATQYTSVTKDDLIRKMRRATVKTDWMPPIDGLPTFNTGNKYGLYSNYAVVGTMEEILESQNENLGNDIASMDGRVLFRRSPLIYVPKLELDTTNPVYGINWGEFKTTVLRGWWMRETVIDVQPGQHTISATHLDCQFNWLTRNRRRHFVIATDVTMPA